MALFLAPICLGFAHAKVGDRIESVVLPTIDGGSHPLLGQTEVSVFVFFDPAKEHSQVTIAQVAAVQKKLIDAPVHWTAVVSGSDSVESTLAATVAAGLEMPVLVDAEDALYGKLGVVMHPVIGITDRDHILHYYLPFRKVNYAMVIETAVLQVLGRVTVTEFRDATDPPLDEHKGRDAGKRAARLNLAQRLFEAGRFDDALALVRTFLEQVPDDIDALILNARFSAAKGDVSSAKAAAQQALELDPENVASQELRRIMDTGQ